MTDFNRPNFWDHLIWGLIIGWLGSYILIESTLPNFPIKITDFIRYLILGATMGLAAGISNYSLKKTIVAISSGVIVGVIVYYYVLTHPAQFNDFDYRVPPFLFWYALTIAFLFAIIDMKEIKDIFAWLFASAILSFIGTVIICLLGWLATGWCIGLGFAGSKNTGIPYIVVGIFAIAALNLTINIGRWRKLE